MLHAFLLKQEEAEKKRNKVSQKVLNLGVPNMMKIKNNKINYSYKNIKTILTDNIAPIKVSFKNSNLAPRVIICIIRWSNFCKLNYLHSRLLLKNLDGSKKSHNTFIWYLRNFSGTEIMYEESHFLK